MADELTTRTLSIDQALHGYSGGHRLIARSAKLSPADERVMLVFSDASGPSGDEQVQGYLTGYPLPGSGKYVLARTWPAPEMSRPGCVWTHSLLIDFADLATLSSAGGLLSLFQRPSGAFESYEGRLSVPSGNHRRVSDVSRIGGLLNALYLQPTKKVEMRGRDADADEQLIVAVWFQQWPRLRRSFRFCTLVGVDRSSTSEIFDLQITNATGRSQRTIVRDAVPVEDELAATELYSAQDDICQPSVHGLRSFLRQIAGDVSSGRSAMVPLCRLYDALKRPELGPARFDLALTWLDSLSSEQGRAARAMAFNGILEAIETVNDRAIEFAVDGIPALDDEVDITTIIPLGITLWRKSPGELMLLAERSASLEKLVQNVIDTMDVDSLIDGVRNEPAIGLKIALRRPDLLSHADFWSIREIDARSALGIVRANGLDSSPIIGSLIKAARQELAEDVVQIFGAESVIEALSNSESLIDMPQVIAWLIPASRHAAQLGRPLSSGRISRRIVVELSNFVSPDDVPNDYGDDPWAIAASVQGELEATEEAKFGAFLFARALGDRSRSCARLFALSFDRVHTTLADRALPEESWQQIERRLSYPWVWEDWDRCRRIREAVVAKFVNLWLDPSDFPHLTDDPKLRAALADVAAKTWRGRHYLDEVKNRIVSRPDTAMRSYVRHIRELLE